jgi:two-component system cell cycle sensor histidine kinase/response regulator CckA
MEDKSRTNPGLIEKISALKQRINELEQSESAHKGLEDALRLSEENLRRCLDDSPLGICIVTVEGEIIYVNRTILDIYSLDDLKITPLKTFYTPESFAEYKIRKEKRKRGEYALSEYEISIVRKDGEVRNLQVFRKAILWDGEKQFMVIYQDFTERKRAEEALRKSEQRLRAFLENSAVIAWLKDEQGRYVYLSENYQRRFGVHLQDWIGKTDFDIWPRDVAEVFRKNDLTVMASDKPLEVVEETQQPDGSHSWWLSSKFCLRDGTGNKYVGGLGVDITERKQAEEELRDTEQRLSSIYDTVGDSIFHLEVETEGQYRFVSVNPSLCSVTGLSREQIVGKTVTEVIPEPSLTMVLGKYRQAIEAKTIVRWEEVSDYPTRRLIGEVSVVPVFDDKGKCTHLVGSVHDITNRTRAEEEKRNLEERLQHAEKMEAIGTLAGGVAHNLNNMLGALIGHAEILKGELKKTDPRYNMAEGIMTAGLKAATVVQDLLTMARRGVVLKERASLNKIVADQIKSSEIRNMLDYHPHVTIKTKYERELLDINASAIHIERILTNLISNALRAIGGGDGTITFMTENRYQEGPLMSYEAVPKGEYAVLSVSDTGSGIFPEHIKNLFEPFFMQKTLKKGGTGLGLSVIWGAMKDHDGYIDVTSELGQGTTFSLYFPVTRDNTIRWVGHSVDEYRGYGETILVVDDEDAQCRVAEMMLTRLNYVVKAVESGEEALEYLTDHEVDLIVLDMLMEPGMAGYDTYRRILEIKKKQKAIIFSGFSKTERVKMAQELGAGEFIMKPYLMERLGMAVRKALDRKR